MAHRQIAAFSALSLMVLALTACATAEQPAPQTAVEATGVPEFHQASIGNDALRGELPSEN
jgi:hypothetical protein